MAKPKRWVFASDNHGDKVDRASAAALREFLKFFKPDIRIHGGDAFDLCALRRGAGNEEVLEDLQADLDAGTEFLRWYKPHVWLRGNHDERLVDGINSHNPVLRRFASLAWSDIMDTVGDCEVLPYCKRRGVYKLGNLSFAHGFASGMYSAKKMAECFNNVVFGHVHARDSFTISGIEPRTGHASGCMCALDMPYNRAHLNTLRQSHGFCFGFVHENGESEVFHAYPVNGVWRFPTEFKEYRHAS